MKNVFWILSFLFCIAVSGQSPTENYVKVTTYLAPSTGEITENDTIVKVMYYDGLGRPKQIVDVRAGGGGQDIVTPVRYDQFGRQTRDYLPYATVTQNGNIHPDPIAEMEAFYGIDKYSNTTNPYSEKILEASPLNRVMEQGAPGNPWAADPLSDTDHTIKFEYSANTTDEVRLYRVTTVANSYGVHLSTYVPTLEPSGFYNPGTLYKTITKDENWQPGDSLLHTSEEFKDLSGRVVLKRTYADLPGQPQAPHDTYYVYDKFSNLSYVIPPKVDTSDGVSDDELNELCYQYVYDHRNRIIEKKLPGKAWEDIVYNKGNHPVFTRDKQLKDQGKWLFTKYDKFGRIVYTGLFTSTDSRETLQTTLENHTPIYESKADTPTIIDGTEVYYTNDAFPNTGLELLTIQYYDTYNFDLDGATAEMSYNIVPTTETRSLSTGSKTRVLETDKWITSVVYYDKKARPIYTYTKNPYLNTIDKIKSKVDFVGKVLETTSVHTKDGLADITTIEKFTYDRMGRLLKHTHQLAGQQEEALIENMYDELGQLVQKNVGNTPASPLQTVDYSYNIRGWLTKINDVDNIGNDLFSFDIHYNDPTAGGTALYNGNISQTHWRTNNTDSSLKHYSYSYDPLNRITGAIHNTGNYNLNAISYDKNGNITFLERKGHVNSAATSFGVMDGLAYTYDSGNKLIRVNDQEDEDFGFKDVWTNGVEYTYDANGNMLSDTNKGITNISYNHMNLPVQITINGENIFYIYDASGAKQQKVAEGTTTAYAGRYIYENGSLKFISHPEGYIEPDGGGGYDYVYQYKDHLGNIRLSYSDANDDGSVDATEIMSEKNYYPFGLIHKGYNGEVQGTYHPYGYNGKEEQVELGLEWLDFSARNYDAALGRWMNLDPLAEKMRRHSPYNYAFDNPVYFIDYDGMMPSAGGGNPIIKKLIQALSKNRSKLIKSQKSYTKLIKEHKKKLEDFNKDPIGNSSKEALEKMKRDNPTDEVLLERAKGRAKALEKQIAKQEGELKKINEQIDKVDNNLKRLNDKLDGVSSVAVAGTINSGNTDDDVESSGNGSSKSDKTAKKAIGLGEKMTKFVEKFGTTVFGDNDFGRMIDEINPLNLGLNELFKLSEEILNED